MAWIAEETRFLEEGIGLARCREGALLAARLTPLGLSPCPLLGPGGLLAEREDETPGGNLLTFLGAGQSSGVGGGAG